MRCVRCKGENPGEARFCLHCGTAIGSECKACGAALPEGSKFCPECGDAVEAAPAPASYTPRHLSDEILAVRSAIEGERKQVTVLFCDIVRSSALAAEAGPEEYHRVVDCFFGVALDEVHHYEGTVNQFLGDGFMALFGAPIAHEDHTRRAALAALGVKERAEIDLRIGINSGAVVVGAIGDDLRMDYTAFGDTTVLAARLQAAALPGDVLVSSETAESLRGYFELEETQPVAVKERTVHALRVTGRGPRTSPIDESEQQLSPFFGTGRRARDVAAGPSRRGRGRRTGYRPFWRSRPRQVAAGLRAPSRGRGRRDGLRRPLSAVRERGPVSPRSRPGAGCVRHRAGGRRRRRRREDRRHAGRPQTRSGPRSLPPPRARRHVRRRGPGRARPGHDQGTDLRRPAQPLARASRAAAVGARRGHALDRPHLRGVPDRARRRASVRPDAPAHDLPSRLQPALDRQVVRDAGRAAAPFDEGERTGRRLDPGARRRGSCRDRRARRGEPLLPRGARPCRTTARERRLGRPGARHRAGRAGCAIDRLDAREKSAVQVAAVLGREFSLDLVEEVWDGDGPLLPALDELKRREFLQERHGETERTFVFKHALTRDVAYDGLLDERRRHLHARAGATIERSYEGRLHEKYELLAFHYSRSAEREQAADYLELANRKAAARHAMEEALGYFYDALAILEDLPDSEENRRRRLTLLLDQTGEFHWLHRHEEFHELLLRHERLALELDDPGLIGTFYARLSHRQLVFGEYEQAMETARKALEFCERAGNAEAAALSYALLQWTHMMLGDYEGAIVYSGKALEQLAVSFDSMWFMYVQAGSAITHLMCGRWDDALREIDKAAAKGAERSDNGMIAFGTAFGAWVSLEKRDWATALDQANSAKEIAPTVYFRGFAFGFLASALCHAGAVDQGLPMLEQIVSMIRASRHELAWILMAWRLADAYVVTGDLPRAKEVLLEIHESATRGKVKFFIGGSERGLADIACAEGDPHTALRLLGPAIETLRAIRSENELALALAARGRAQRLLGNGDEALAPLEEAAAIFERLGTLEEPDRVRQELAAQAV